MKNEKGNRHKKSSKIVSVIMGILCILMAVSEAAAALAKKEPERLVLVFIWMAMTVAIFWYEWHQYAAETKKQSEQENKKQGKDRIMQTNGSKEPEKTFTDLFENAAFSGNDNQMEYFAISQSGIPCAVVYELRADDDLQVVRSRQISFAKLRTAAKQAMESAELSFAQDRLKLYSMMEEYNWKQILDFSKSLEVGKDNAKYWRSQRKGWSFHPSEHISHVTLNNYLGCDVRLDCAEDGCTVTLVDRIRDEEEYTREISIRLPQSFPSNFSANDLAKILNCLPPAGPYQEDSGPYRNIEGKELWQILRDTWKDYEHNKLQKKQAKEQQKKQAVRYAVQQVSQSSQDKEAESQAAKLKKFIEVRHSDCIRTILLKNAVKFSSDKEPEGLITLELLEKTDGWYLEWSIRYPGRTDITQGQEKVEFDPTASPTQLFQQIQKNSAIRQEIRDALDAESFTEMMKSRFAPFRYCLAMQSGPYLHRLDSHASEGRNWEIETLGIDLNSGRPYLELARQRSFGFVSGGESTYLPLTIKEYQKALGRFEHAPSWAKKLNQDNWKKLLEQPLKVFDERCQERITNMKRLSLHGPFQEPKGKPVQKVIITRRQRFGAAAACFRKLQEGYRLFYVYTTDPGHPYLPAFTNQGLEDRINDILEKSTSVDCFDRLLTQEESMAFLCELEDRRPEDDEIWNDVYGSARMQFSILFSDGTEEKSARTSKYAERLMKAAAELAAVGLDHKKDASEASEVTDESVKEVSEAQKKECEKTSKRVQQRKQVGIQKIQKDILEFVKKNEGNSLNYNLGFFMFHEAAPLIQKFDQRTWEGIGFDVDLSNRRITITLLMYPDMSPRTRSNPPITEVISVQDFLECIKIGTFSPEWSFIENEEDWDAIFDEKLVKAIEEKSKKG